MTDDVASALRRVASLVHGGKSPDNFSPASLMPLLNMAQRWACGWLEANGVSEIKEENEFDVPAADTTAVLTAVSGYGEVHPVRPIRIWEHPLGSTDWTPMIQGRISLNSTAAERRVWWDWYDGVLHLPPGTLQTTLKVTYYRRFDSLRMPSQSLAGDILDACVYKAAADAVAKDNASYAAYLIDQGETKLSNYIKQDSHIKQQVPKKRRVRFSGLSSRRIF